MAVKARVEAVSKALALPRSGAPSGPRPPSDVAVALQKLIAEADASPPRPAPTSAEVDQAVERERAVWTERKSESGLVIAFRRLIGEPLAAHYEDADGYARAVRRSLEQRAGGAL